MRDRFEPQLLNQLSQRDIADQLRISVSMVEKYVKQAVNHCEKRLNELNIEAANNGGCAP